MDTEIDQNLELITSEYVDFLDDMVFSYTNMYIINNVDIEYDDFVLLYLIFVF